MPPLKLPRLHKPHRDHIVYWLTSDLAFSSAPADEDLASLQDSGIRTIVDLRAEAPDRRELVLAAGLEYVRLPVEEGQAPSDAELKLVTDLIAARLADGPVLVHCREGRGRSALVACATLVRFGYPLADAYQFLRRARPEIALSEAQSAALTRFAAAAPDQPSRSA